MDLRDFGSTLARWWWLSIATLLAAIAAGAALYSSASPTYSANSTIVMMPPKAVLVQAQVDKSQYAPNNPLLYLDSLGNSRDVVVRNLSGKDVTDQLKKQFPGAQVTVAADATSNSPLILVKSTASDRQTALDSMKAVTTMVPTSLTQLQDRLGIQPLQRITSMTVTMDTDAAKSSKVPLEMGIVGFAGTSLLGLALIALLDQLRNRRRRRAAAREDVVVEDDRELVADEHRGLPATGTTVRRGTPATGRGATSTVEGDRA